MRRFTFADRNDSDHFVRGVAIVEGSVWHRLRGRLLWWRQPRSVVVDVDHVEGSVTVARLRWSWLRWRWVRA